MKDLSALAANDSGQDVIEYCPLAALVGLAAVAGIKGVATQINLVFLKLDNALNCPQGTSCMSGH